MCKLTEKRNSDPAWLLHLLHFSTLACWHYENTLSLSLPTPPGATLFILAICLHHLNLSSNTNHLREAFTGTPIYMLPQLSLLQSSNISLSLQTYLWVHLISTLSCQLFEGWEHLCFVHRCLAKSLPCCTCLNFL